MPAPPLNLLDFEAIARAWLAADDGRLAIAHGAAAVIVSNHGGRQLDGSLATIDALPEIVEALDAGDGTCGLSDRHRHHARARPAHDVARDASGDALARVTGEDPMPTSRKHADPKKQTPSSPDAPGERPGPARPSQGGYGHDSRAATREEGRTHPTTPHKSRTPK